MAVVGIVPAAGYATRLQPLQGSKELLPVAGKPVMDHVLERMLAAGCTELRIVTRPEKQDVIDHAATLGARVVTAYPETTSASFAAGLTGLAEDDIVLLGWPDTIWEPFDGYVPLVRDVEAGAEIALGLFRIHPDDLPRSDVIRFGPAGEVVAIDIKPAVPASEWIWGCATARCRALATLGEAEWPGSHFDAMLRAGLPVRSVRLSDRWLDIGTRDALDRLDDPELFVNRSS
jgi:NDP-sugar pyrophosphorylase family protein